MSKARWIVSVIVSVVSVLTAQPVREGDVAPLIYWQAPSYWRPTAEEALLNPRKLDSSGVAIPRASLSGALRADGMPLGSDALVFVAMTPCRVVDTRAGQGFSGSFGPPILAGQTARTFPVRSSPTCQIPPIAEAYSLNITVVPPGLLGYITVYPSGQTRPIVSTLNSLQGFIVANAAVVPAGTLGSVDVFANNPTHLIIDINGYYAPPSDVNDNTAIGRFALENSTTGRNNTAFGALALLRNTSGGNNTAHGSSALLNSTTANNNTALGFLAGSALLTGSNNILIGSAAGLSLTGNESGNIMIGSRGLAGLSDALSIGDQITQTFIGGIRGVNPGGTPVSVVINGSNQLGVIASSRRYKEDIRDMDHASSGLMRLRPVTFRYKKANDDGSKPIDYGLIAEELAEVYPDLVVRGADAQIETIQYQKLTPMLLNELQKQHLQIQADHEVIRALEARLAALEARTADSAQ